MSIFILKLIISLRFFRQKHALELHTAVFYRGREHNQRLCPSKILQFPDKTVEFHRIFKQNLQQHGIVAGHTVTLNHVFALFYIANDGGSVKPHPLFAARLSYSLTWLRTAFSSRVFFTVHPSASLIRLCTAFFSRGSFSAPRSAAASSARSLPVASHAPPPPEASYS